MHGGLAGGEHECRLLQRGDGGDADDRLARAAWQYDDTAPASSLPARPHILARRRKEKP